MKTIITFLLATLLLMNIACKETNSENPNPVNTIEAYSAKINNTSYKPNVNDVYVDTFINSGVLLTQIIADFGEESIVLQFAGRTAGTYVQSGPNSAPYNVAIYYKGLDSAFVCNSSSGGGTLTISKYDILNSKVSGSFSFKGKAFGGGTIKNITNGVFENVNIN